jgi:microcin C transport system substrate-binding protein
MGRRDHRPDEQQGLVVLDGRRVNAETGRPLAFTILLNSPSMERIALPFVANLRRLGIDAGVRTVNTAQYQNRIHSFDFDMTVAVWGQSLSPGNEQWDFWTSQAADRPGSRNLAGIRSEAVDQLVDLLIAATTRDELRARAALPPYGIAFDAWWIGKVSQAPPQPSR